MLEVISKKPALFPCLSTSLRNDFDVVLLAVANYRRNVYSLPRRCFWARYVRELLDRHETFTGTVLMGVSAKCNDSASSLIKLDQGEATALAHKKLIAEYLDVPIGKQLRLLRQAYENLRSP